MSVFHTKLEQVALDKGVENKFVAQSQKNDLSIFNPEFLKKHKNSYINFDEYYTHHNQYIIVPWGSPIKEGFVLTLLVVFHFVASCFLFNYIFHDRFLGLFLTSFVCFFLFAYICMVIGIEMVGMLFLIGKKSLFILLD